SGMDEDRNVEARDLFVKRPQHFRIQIPVLISTGELDGFQSQLLDRPSDLAHGLLYIGKIDPGDADKVFLPGDVLGDGVVVGARELPAELGIELVNKLAVVRDEYLAVEAVLLHVLAADVEVPAAFLERVHDVAVAVVRRDFAGDPLAEADIFAVVFLDLDMPAPRMGNAVDEAYRPVMGVAVDIHGSLL